MLLRRISRLLVLSVLGLCTSTASPSDYYDEYPVEDEDATVIYVAVQDDTLAPMIPSRDFSLSSPVGSATSASIPSSTSAISSEQTPAEDRLFFAPYKLPFWGLPYGIYSNGGFVNPGLFPFVPGGPGFPPYDGIFGGPFGPGAFPGPGLNPFAPGVGTPMGIPQPAFPPPGPPAPTVAPPVSASGAVATKSKPKPKRKPKTTTTAPYYAKSKPTECGCTKHHPPTHSYRKPKPSRAPCPLNHAHEYSTTAAPYYAPSSTTTPAPTTAASTTSATPAYSHHPSLPLSPQMPPTMAPIILMYTPAPYRRSYHPPPPAAPSRKPCPNKLRAELALLSLNQMPANSLPTVSPTPPSTTTSTTTPPPSSSPYSQASSIYLVRSSYSQHPPTSTLYSSTNAQVSSSSSSDGYVLIDQDELKQLQLPLTKIRNPRKSQGKRKKPDNRMLPLEIFNLN